MIDIYHSNGISEEDTLTILKTMAKYKLFFVKHMMVNKKWININCQSLIGHVCVHLVMLEFRTWSEATRWWHKATGSWDCDVSFICYFWIDSPFVVYINVKVQYAKLVFIWDVSSVKLFIERNIIMHIIIKDDRFCGDFNFYPRCRKRKTRRSKPQDLSLSVSQYFHFLCHVPQRSTKKKTPPALPFIFFINTFHL